METFVKQIVPMIPLAGLLLLAGFAVTQMLLGISYKKASDKRIAKQEDPHQQAKLYRKLRHWREQASDAEEDVPCSGELGIMSLLDYYMEGPLLVHCFAIAQEKGAEKKLHYAEGKFEKPGELTYFVDRERRIGAIRSLHEIIFNCWQGPLRVFVGGSECLRMIVIKFSEYTGNASQEYEVYIAALPRVVQSHA